MTDRGLGATLAAIDDVEGWLTDGQAARLQGAAMRVGPGGTIVEIGSFRGKSAIVLARTSGDDVVVVCIDPHAGSDRGPQEFTPDPTLGDADYRAFHANLARAGIAGKVRHVRASSADAQAHAAVDAPIDVLYVDGAHRYGPALADLRDWGGRVAPGGRLLVHDTFSSIGVTLAVLRLLWLSPQWRYDGRTSSLAEWERLTARPDAETRAVSVVRQLLQLPWFLRNVVVKALILARLRPLARLLGHGPADGPWPY